MHYRIRRKSVSSSQAVGTAAIVFCCLCGCMERSESSRNSVSVADETAQNRSTDVSYRAPGDGTALPQTAEPFVDFSEDSDGGFAVTNTTRNKLERVTATAFPPVGDSSTLLLALGFSADIRAIEPGTSVKLKRTEFTNGYGANLAAEDKVGVLHIGANIDGKRKGRSFEKGELGWRPSRDGRQWMGIYEAVFDVRMPWKKEDRLKVKVLGGEGNASNFIVMNEEHADIADVRFMVCPAKFHGSPTLKDMLFFITLDKIGKDSFEQVKISDMKNHWGDAPPGPTLHDCHSESIIVSGRVKGVVKGTIVGPRL
jgi:hypothetical protein